MPKQLFHLNRRQISAINHLLDQADKAGQAGSPGSILLQPVVDKNAMKIVVYGQFIPEEYAKRINAIIKECNTKS